jgi:fatty-acyl-CoA synthase
VTVTPGPARAGKPGEVLVQGPNITAGYWNRSRATADALLPGEWLRTGDLAVEDEEGYVSIVGRLENMYIPGGETVYPAEVEQGVYAHPAVAECPVIGVPDEKWVAWRPGERSS